jgi:hypothetical protein
MAKAAPATAAKAARVILADYYPTGEHILANIF